MFAVTVVLPTPPFPDVITIISLIQNPPDTLFFFFLCALQISVVVSLAVALPVTISVSSAKLYL